MTTEGEIGALVLINLPIAFWVFFHWRKRKKDLSKRHLPTKSSEKYLLLCLVGVCLVSIWSIYSIDYTRSISLSLVGFRLLTTWCVCFHAINLWHWLEMRKIKRASCKLDIGGPPAGVASHSSLSSPSSGP